MKNDHSLICRDCQINNVKFLGTISYEISWSTNKTSFYTRNMYIFGRYNTEMRYESDPWADSRTGGLRSLAVAHKHTEKSWQLAQLLLRHEDPLRDAPHLVPLSDQSRAVEWFPSNWLPTCKDAKQKSLEFFIAKGPKKPETRNYRHYRYKKRGPLNQTPPLYIKRCFINYFGSMDKGIPLQKHYL